MRAPAAARGSPPWTTLTFGLEAVQVRPVERQAEHGVGVSGRGPGLVHVCSQSRPPRLHLQAL